MNRFLHWLVPPIRWPLVAAVAAVLASTLAGPLPAHAQGTIITVTTYSDELNSSNNGKCSLREAVRAANADAAVGGCPAGNGTDTIVLKSGRYRLTRTGRGEDDAAKGDLDLRGTLAIVGAGETKTTIDGNRIDRVFDVLDNANVTLSKLTIRNGRAQYSGTVSSGNGGGIDNKGALSLDQVTVRNNRSEFAQQSGGGSGGGISSRLYGGTLQINNSTIRDNSGYIGGGIAGSFDITNSTIVGNNGEIGGGLSGFGTITTSTINGNTSKQGGGGISTADGLIVHDSTISNNHSDTTGGGIAYTSNNNQSITINGTTISGNTSTWGGGLAVDSGAVSITNSTFSGNKAKQSGGGVYAYFGDTSFFLPSVQLNNSTFALNVADDNNDGIGQGGALYNDSYDSGIRIGIRNTLLAVNTDRGGESPVCSGSITSYSYNLIRDTTGCDIRGTTTGNKLNIDPKIGSLASNGGPTKTHALNNDSPAVDNGSRATVGSNEDACATTDQRGVSRPRDGNNNGTKYCDIGAVERQSVSTSKEGSTAPEDGALEESPIYSAPEAAVPAE